MFLKNGDAHIVAVLDEKDLTEEQKKSAQTLVDAPVVIIAPAQDSETQKSETN